MVDGKSSNIERDLEIFAKQLFKENAFEFIEGKSLSIKECMWLKDDLYSKQKNIEKDIEQLSQRATKFFNQYGFTKEHFNKGIFYKHFAIFCY